jgi:hypothetical protein
MKTKILSFVLGIVVILITSNSYATDNTSSKSKRGYVVHSVVDGHQTMTAYNKKGKWVYTIQRYGPDNLDKNLVDRVRSVYYDYGVMAMQKVEQPGMDEVYVVHLENEKSIKIVRVTSDEMELVKDFIKG